MSINNVTLVGRLTKDIEVKLTSNNMAVANFYLAVDKFSKNNEKKADFIPCVVWGKNATNLERYTNKGSMIAVQGSIATSNYQNPEGKTIYKVEVNATNIQFLDYTKENSENRQDPRYPNAPKQAPTFDNDFDSFDGTFNVSDEDMPF